MKKLLIFYVILTLVMAFALSLPSSSKKEQKEYIVTDTEMEEYKKSASDRFPNLTEEQINESANIYFEQMKQMQEMKNTNNGMDFWSALKLSAIISAVIIGILIIFFVLKTSYFNELFGESPHGEMGNLFRFFFGKMR